MLGYEVLALAHEIGFGTNGAGVSAAAAECPGYGAGSGVIGTTIPRGSPRVQDCEFAVGAEHNTRQMPSGERLSTSPIAEIQTDTSLSRNVAKRSKAD
jgi:hypothetical protein